MVVTPSHNPPEDGGFKYNPPNGGPADGDVTRAIEERANQLLREGLERIPRVSVAAARRAETTTRHDYVTPYVESLSQIIDMDAIAAATLRIGVDPMGGSGIAYWAPIAERYGLATCSPSTPEAPLTGAVPSPRRPPHRRTGPRTCRRSAPR